MGYKDVCLDCRKSFNRGTDVTISYSEKCPQCGNRTFALNHKFKPPKKSELSKWKVVSYIVNHGFNYDHMYEHLGSGVYQELGKYPETLQDAKEFVKTFNTNGVKK